MGILDIFRHKPTREEYFQDLLLLKKKINTEKTLIKMAKNDKARLAHQKKLEKYLQLFEAVQEHMIDLQRGLYVGIGVNLRDEKLPEPLYISWSSRNSHIGVQGTTRVGKTVFMEVLIRQLVKKRENVIVIDPKGSSGQEIIATVIESLAEADALQDFMYFSPAFPELSDYINLLYGMNNEAVASLIALYTETPNSEQFYSDVVYKVVLAITTAFEAIELFRDPYGTKTKILIEKEIKKWKSLIKDKGYHRKIVEASKNIKDPDLAQTGQLSPKVQISEKDYRFNRTLITFRDIAEYASYEKLEELHDIVSALYIKDDVDENLQHELEYRQKQALAILDDILVQEREFFNKISVSLSTILTQLSAGSMGQILCDLRINPLMINLSDPDKRVAAVIQPFPMQFKKVSDMMSKAFISMVENVMSKVGATGRAMNERINLLIDEAASIAYPGIESLFNKAGGLGTSLYVFTQSFADWEATLGKERAKVVMDNINNKFRMRMNDVASCEQVAKEFGTKKVFRTSAMVDESGGRHMIDTVDEWIVAPEDVATLPVARAFLKSDESMYVVDLPYYSGPKGYIEMPKIKMEEMYEHMEQLNKEFQNAHKQLENLHKEIV